MGLALVDRQPSAQEDPSAAWHHQGGEPKASGVDAMVRIRVIGVKLMESQFQYVHSPPEEFNHGAQLVAIRGLLYRQEQADQKLSDKIREADEVARRTRGSANDHAIDVWVELAEMSCYQDAAHSMAAVGMIAPLIESVFRTAFRSIRNELPSAHLVRNIIERVGRGWHEGVPACRPRVNAVCPVCIQEQDVPRGLRVVIGRVEEV